MTAGMVIAISSTMIEMTTSNSIKVKPCKDAARRLEK